MKNLVGVLMLTGGLLMSMEARSQAGPLVDLLPAEIHGWSPSGQDALVDRDGLFQLINGGAEVYRALNVRQVIERRYSKAKAPDILVDIFDMGGSNDAYGAYHHDMREGPSANIGTESERQGGNLHFWKDRFFVSIVPLRAGSAGGEAVLAMGQAIAAAIRRSGPPPDLVGLLPRDGLVESQVHYFHDWLLFARHTLLADENILELGPETEGLLARYRSPTGDDQSAEGPALLIIRYPSAAAAASALTRATSGLAALSEPRALKLERRKRVLLGVLDAPDPAFADRLLRSISPTRGGPR